MDEKKRRLLTSTPPGSEPDIGSPADPAGQASPAGRTDRASASAVKGSGIRASSSEKTGHTASFTATPRTRPPMSPWGRIWRIGATAIALVILTAGQFLNTNDFFPLGSLTQYATAKDLNGSVNSTCIMAQFPDADEPRQLAFNTDTVGIERGDIESQLSRVIDNPELLQTLADSYIRLHPDDPAPETMILCRKVTQLRDGQRVCDPELKILARWEVR